MRRIVLISATQAGKRRLRLDPTGRGKLRAAGGDTILRIATTTQPKSRRAVATVVVPG